MFDGDGQKFSGSGVKKTGPQALIQKHTQWLATVENKSRIPDIFIPGDVEILAGRIF